MRRLSFVLVLVGLTENAAPADLSFSARMSADTFCVGEHIWALFAADNLTDSVVPALPLDFNYPIMRFDVLDSTGTSVELTDGEVLYSSGDSDTLTARGHLRGSGRLDYRMRFRDTLTGDGYVESGSYRAIFRWYYSPARYDGSPKPYLADTADFVVVNPSDSERPALDSYRSARAATGLKRCELLRSAYGAYKNSRYGDELLWNVLMFAGHPECDYGELDRIVLSRRFAIDYPDHPSSWGFVYLVYSRNERRRPGQGEMAVRAMLDSLPVASVASQAALDCLNRRSAGW